MNNTLESVVTFGALAVIALILLSFWQKAAAQNAAAQVALTKQRGYTSLETMFGQDISNYLFQN